MLQNSNDNDILQYFCQQLMKLANIDIPDDFDSNQVDKCVQLYCETNSNLKSLVDSLISKSMNPSDDDFFKKM